WPNATAEQDHRRERDPGRRPHRRDDAVRNRKRKPEFRAGYIDDPDRCEENRVGETAGVARQARPRKLARRISWHVWRTLTPARPHLKERPRGQKLANDFHSSRRRSMSAARSAASLPSSTARSPGSARM